MSVKLKLEPKNWDSHQQYKDRKPQWIKLHRDLLNDFAYSSVRIGTKATLPLLWILSCEYEDGIIEATLEEISFRIHIDKSTVQTAIDELLEIGMYKSVQKCTEPYLEKRREEKRRECTTPFIFSLSKQTSVTSLSKEYLTQLKQYIDKSEYDLSYADFINGLEAKGNKYKNFKSAYVTWAKNQSKWSKETKQNNQQVKGSAWIA